MPRKLSCTGSAPDTIILAFAATPPQPGGDVRLDDTPSIRVPDAGHAERSTAPLQVPSWPFVLLAIPVVVRALIYSVALMTEPWIVNPARFTPAWAQVMVATLFCALAALLLLSGRADLRAWALGLFIFDAGATLLEPFVRGIAQPPVPVWFAEQLRTDAFQAAFIWFFASAFPQVAQKRWLARAFVAGTWAALALGVLLVAFTEVAHANGGATGTRLLSLASSLERYSPGDSDWYFTLQFLLMAPLLGLMPLKLREAGPNDRRRFLWLTVGIVVGFLPLVLKVLLVTIWPTYAINAPPAYTRFEGALILIALTAVPIAGAYAALVQRTLDVRLVIGTALKYLLARSFIRALTAAPFVILLLIVAWNREQSITSLVSGPLGLTLAALTAAGLVAALTRRQLMGALDRRFFRQEIDARTTLLAVSDAVRRSTSIDELRDTLAGALEASLHPSSVATAVAGRDDNLHALDADLPPLPRGSALAQLLAGNDLPLDLDPGSSPIVERLGIRDRDWCRASRGAAILPLRGAGNLLLGVVALGEKRSELPYSDDDRRLLAAVGSAGGLALDRILSAARETHDTTSLGLADPPARECVDCGAVTQADAITCDCGGLLQRANAPHILSDRLRFVQRIGAGGMGVVYRALDLRLNQVRAVKTLSGSDPVMVARLKREARAMAAAKHQNLATLHGIELWRGAPMLVMEFLDGMTLAERLRRRPLVVDEAAALGARLADALGVLHGTGILHRDIKPSNIGFSADNVPKLLDFGLARLVPQTEIKSTTLGEPESGHASWSESASTDAVGIRGTPAYLSPEVLSGEAPSPRHDLWSLSVTLLEACTGRNPFRAQTVAATVARVLKEPNRVADAAAMLPLRARELFAELLGPIDGRPATADQLADRLRQFTRNGG